MAILEGSISGNLQEVDLNNNAFTRTPGYTDLGVPIGGGSGNGPAIFSENDPGEITAKRYVSSPETDQDYRLRISSDTVLDDETFNYLAQNTSKHNNQNTTLTYAYATGGLLTNASSITTTTTGLSSSTYAMFPMFTNGASLYVQMEFSFSNQPVSNTIFDFGLFLRPTTNPYGPIDGTYFRLNSGGLLAVINHNGSESTLALPFIYVNNRVYKYTITASNNATEFWIDDVLYGSLITPVGQAQPFMSSSLPFSFRHVITGGAAGGIFQATLRGYGVSMGGITVSKTLGELGSSVFGSYQGLSGGTQGSLMSGTVTTGSVVPPTAAVPSNTTAALGSGLGGTFYETATLAVAVDGIISSYQVPAGTVSVIGKRLKINSVSLSSFVQTAIVGGPYNARFYIAFGHTAVSLATGEAATTKAARRVMTPMNQAVTAAQAVNTLVDQSVYTYSFINPIYVNPGEFLQLVTTHTGTVATAGVVAHHVSWDYTWE